MYSIWGEIKLQAQVPHCISSCWTARDVNPLENWIKNAPEDTAAKPPVNSPRMGRSAEICKDEATMFHIKARVCSYGLYEGIIGRLWCHLKSLDYEFINLK